MNHCCKESHRPTEERKGDVWVTGETNRGRTYLRTYAGDPLAILVIERLSLSPAQSALIAFAIALIVDVISFALVGSEVIALSGWIEAWAYAVYMYVIFPAIVGAYVWVSLAAARLFFGLRQSQALEAPTQDYDHFIKGQSDSLKAL